MKKIIISLITLILLLSMLFNTVYATETDTDYSNLPSSFDLRDKIKIRVENQGQRSWCNSYATVKMIETYLQITKNIDYNLSESYIAYSNVPYFGGTNTKLVDIKAINNRSVYTVTEKQPLVLEDDFPNNDYLFTTANKEKFDNVRKVIKSLKYKNIGKENRNEEIKRYIIQNGGIQVNISAKEKWYNSNTNSIYCPEYNFKSKTVELYEKITDTTERALTKEEIEKIDNEIEKLVKDEEYHAITIIGWDDNYSKNNFNANNRPNTDGAWLILNSWGANWGNNGTAWLSYGDEYFLNCDIKGIENVLLEGELNADFSYEITSLSKSSNTMPDIEITATIKTDDEIEEIEGWTKNGEYTYTKVFKQQFAPYTIELCSKIDNAKTTVTVEIPNEEFTQGFKEPNKFLLFLQGATFVILPILGFIIIIVFIKKILFRPFKKKK